MCTLTKIITTVFEEPVTEPEVLTLLKVRGQYRAAVYDLVEQQVVRQHCERRGIRLTDEFLAEFMRAENVRVGLDDQAARATYLAENGATEADWRGIVTFAALKSLLKRRVISDEQVAEYFQARRDAYSHANVARIVCRNEDHARGLLDEIAAGRDFNALAAENSLDRANRITGGYLGEIKRGFLPDRIEDAIFTAADNDVIGPFDEGETWSLYKVYSLNEGCLTAPLADIIRDHLFSDWLQSEVYQAPA